MDKRIVFHSHSFFSPDKITKIKILHMVAKEHPKVIEGRRRLIAVDVLDSGESAENASIDHYSVTLEEDSGSGMLGSGVTEEVEYIQKAVKYSSIFSYMLEPSHLLTQSFENNRKEQEKLSKHICNFGARVEWR